MDSREFELLRRKFFDMISLQQNSNGRKFYSDSIELICEEELKVLQKQARLSMSQLLHQQSSIGVNLVFSEQRPVLYSYQRRLFENLKIDSTALQKVFSYFIKVLKSDPVLVSDILMHLSDRMTASG